jgi:hypothetical protein
LFIIKKARRYEGRATHFVLIAGVGRSWPVLRVSNVCVG